MQVVDRITSSGYSYVAPAVDRACLAVPLLGGIKERIGPYAPPLIQKADLCIDTVYGVVEIRASALRNVANSAGAKVLSAKDAARIAVEERALAVRDAISTTRGNAQTMIGDSIVVARAHKTTLAFVDTLDMLIDRYLPEPEADDAANGKANEKAIDLIPRLLHVPFKIPVRMMHISLAKARSGRDVVQVRIQWARQLTSDQKAKLQELILSRTQAVADKVSSSSLAITLRQGKQSTKKMLQSALQSIDDGKKAVGVRCYTVLEQLHVIEIKDWLLTKFNATQKVTMNSILDVFAVASRRACDVTYLVVGQDRATRIFTLAGERLPFVKIAIRASASTGALSEASSHEAEPQIESSTGATEKNATSKTVVEEEKLWSPPPSP